MIIADHDVSSLFDEKSPMLSFSESEVNQLPIPSSIVYTVWHDELGYIYVGIAGIQLNPEKRNPRSRIRSHTTGRRSGDQFCVYIQDFFVIPELFASKSYTPKVGYLDKLTRDYIHQHLFYRYLLLQGEDSRQAVMEIERQLQRGANGLPKPLLNSRDE